jgi:alpha-beta hydrolase superfamily lysophospholipase
VRAAEVAFSFEREGRSFGGRLTLPERQLGQRLPGVVLVHGSGPMSRDGFMPGQLGLGFGFDFPVYAELARELAALGYVVARYDKRTCLDAGRCGPHSLTSFGLGSSVVAEDASIDDFVEDAKAAYQKLTEYDFVDGSRVVFVGHSQGAQLVPRLLTELESVPSGVMLTPPYQELPELLRQQGERLVHVMRQAKKYDRVREGYELIRASKMLTGLRNGSPTPEYILGQPVQLWRSWLRASQEAPRLARALERPLLVVGGTYDYNVAPEEMRLWSQWFSGSPHRVTVLPCVTHALNCISQEDPTQIEARHIGRRIDSSLLQSLAGFLGTTLARRAQSGVLALNRSNREQGER